MAFVKIEHVTQDILLKQMDNALIVLQMSWQPLKEQSIEIPLGLFALKMQINLLLIAQQICFSQLQILRIIILIRH
jgi:hypothetical protein